LYSSFDLRAILALIKFVRVFVFLCLLPLFGGLLVAPELCAQVTPGGGCAFGHPLPDDGACTVCGYELAPARWRKVAPAESLRLPVPPLFRSFTNVLGVTEVTQWVDHPQKYVNTISAHVDGTPDEWLKKLRAHLAAQGVPRPTVRRADLANRQFDHLLLSEERREGNLRHLTITISKVTDQEQPWIRVHEKYRVDSSSPR